MDCFHDFCLACDGQSTKGPYCSQACRLADLEKASLSSSTEPTTSSASTQQQLSCASSEFGTGSGYILPPAYKFPERAAGYSQASASDDRRPQSSYLVRSPSQQSPQESQELERSLTPSSSRSSLSSTMSSSSPNAMSEQAKQELQEYFSSFDQARAAKRRPSTW